MMKLEKNVKGKIALFVDHPRCSVQGVNCFIEILQSDYNFKIFTKHEVKEDFFDDVDIIAIPGGIGDASTFSWVMKNHKLKIRDHILNNGGRYLGICMGAYWAGKHYLNILEDLDCVQYMRRPNADTHRPHAKNLEVTWNGNQEKMFWYDGCAIVGSGRIDTVATYSNGDVMAGYQNRIGLIGSHPEADKEWYDAYSWMRKVWKDDKRNQDLLKEFVDDLMKR
jgi:phosphoribosylformylglycinamidine (FGAM) synthase-like amidotransferase family enzyme